MGISHYIDSMVEALGNMDLESLEPLSNFSFHPLFDREWIKKMGEATQRLQQKKYSHKLIAESIAGISHLRVQLLFLLLDMKSACIKKEDRIAFATFFHELLLTKAKADPYGFQSNIIHTPKEHDALLNKPFVQGNPEIAKELARLYSAAYHLTNGLYTDFYTDYSAENFGPYPTGKETIKVIKQVQDLRPTLLWNETLSPCSSITITIILKKVKFQCDGVSVHTTYEGDPIQGLDKYLVEIDGTTIVHDPEEISRLRKALEKASRHQWKLLTGLSNEALKQKAVEMRCYVWKDFFTLAGIEWRPEQEMLASVQKPLALDFWHPPVGDQKEYWRRVMNPEDDFLGHNKHIDPKSDSSG